MMKRLLVLFLLALLPCLTLRAQEYRVDNGSAQVDSTLMGRSILSVLGPGVVVNQSPAMKAAFDRNYAKRLEGDNVKSVFVGTFSKDAKVEKIDSKLGRIWVKEGDRDAEPVSIFEVMK